MVEFSRLITTKKGQALNAKMIVGAGPVQFTKVCTSDHEYGLNELENLTGLEGIRQTSAPSRITRTNEVGVKIETVFSNYDLKIGYYMRTLGLYASDPDEEEILYAAAISVSDQCYMPPNNGITSSAAYINLIYAVGNSDNVSLNVDPGCFATIGDLKEIERKIEGFEKLIEEFEIYNIASESTVRRIARDCLKGAEGLIALPASSRIATDEEVEAVKEQILEALKNALGAGGLPASSRVATDEEVEAVKRKILETFGLQGDPRVSGLEICGLDDICS